MKRKSYLPVLMAVFLWLGVSAGLLAKDGPGFGGGYFSVGENWNSLSNLNASLTAAGYTSVPENGLAFGGGGFGINNRFLFGGMGAGISFGSTKANGNEVKLQGGFGLFDVGYVLFSSSNLRVYPLVGIGGGGFTLKILKQGSPSPFGELLKKPAGAVQLTSGDFLLNLGIGFHTLLFKKEKKNNQGYGGFLLGVRAGYLISIVHGKFGLEDAEVPNAPKSPFTGPYIYLTLGGGGSQTK